MIAINFKWTKIFGLFAISLQGIALANPSNPNVYAGKAAFDAKGAVLQITASDKAIINWKDFSINEGELTQFTLPNNTSAVLNRVTGAEISAILGNLEANGKVYLINPNGILIGQNAMIDTAGFLASTLDLPNALFLKGEDLFFKGSSEGSIINLGVINAWDGDVILIGGQIDNKGKINAPNGVAGLGCGQKVLLKPSGDERIFILPSKDSFKRSESGIYSEGDILALQVELKAQGNAYAKAIHHTGQIDALGVMEEGGRVYLVAEGGLNEISGSITAQHIEGKGGTAYLLGDTINLVENASVDVSGTLGQGEVFIGGILKEDEPLTIAKSLNFGSQASICADALLKGDGGDIFLGAQEHIDFFGKISAQGGRSEGDGGAIFIAKPERGNLSGHVMTSAQEGKTGYFILSAQDITLSLDPTIDGAINNTFIEKNLVSSNLCITANSTSIANGDIYLLDPLNYNSKNDLLLASRGDIQIDAQLSNVGSGKVELVAGRDIEFLSDVVFESSNLFEVNANGNIGVLSRVVNQGSGSFAFKAEKSINIGSSLNEQPSELGCHGGKLALSAGEDLNIKGGAFPHAFAQVGSDSNFIASDIEITSIGGDINLQGGPGDFAFAALGHGRIDGEGGNKSGSIIIGSLSGDLILEGGSGQDSYSQLGHYHGNVEPVVANGNIEAINTSGSLFISGGSGKGAYALLGHGGKKFTAGDAMSGDISLSAHEVVLKGGSAPYTNAHIGFFEELSDGVASLSSNLIDVISQTELLLQGGQGSNSSATIGAHLGKEGTKFDLLMLNVQAGSDCSLIGSSNSKDSFAGLGIFANCGDCATNMQVLSGKNLLLLADAGDALINNGRGNPFANPTIDVDVLGNTTLQSGTYGTASITSVGQIFLNIISGDLELSASEQNSAFIKAEDRTTVFAAQNVILSGIERGAPSFIESSRGDITIEADNDLTLNPNSFIRHIGVSEGHLSVTAFGNFTVQGAPNANSFIENKSTGPLDLITFENMNINASIVNSGKGEMNVNVFGDLFIGSPQCIVPSQLGTQEGALNVFVGSNLNLIAGNASGAFAQIGSQGDTIESDIRFPFIGGNITLQGDSASNTFSMIGHRSPNPIIGSILFNQHIGDLVILPGPNPDNYAQIGHFNGPSIR